MGLLCRKGTHAHHPHDYHGTLRVIPGGATNALCNPRLRSMIYRASAREISGSVSLCVVVFCRVLLCVRFGRRCVSLYFVGVFVADLLF